MSDGTTFSLGKKLPTMILILFALSALFFLLAIMANGVITNYYSNNFGTTAISFEETLFYCMAYRDPITHTLYRRIIDKSQFDSFDIDSCLQSRGRDRQAKLILQIDNYNDVQNHEKKTQMFVRESYIKSYPVLIFDNDEFHTGFLEVFVWQP